MQIQKGNVLISEPFLQDPNFERSVVLLCEHDNEEGTLGLVLNHKANITLADVENIAINKTVPVYLGGPVERNTLHFLHKLGETLEGSSEIIEGVYWNGNFEQLNLLLQSGNIDLNDIVFFAGYSGWSPGQLQDELEQNSWVIHETSQKMIFDLDPESMWKEFCKNMGGKYRQWVNFPIDPRLN